MDMDIVKRFICGAKEAYKKVDNHSFNFQLTVESAYKLATNIEKLLKEQEPKTGKWILDDDDANSWECSECGGLLIINDGTPHENNWHFCPYCGTELEDQEVKLDD